MPPIISAARTPGTYPPSQKLAERVRAIQFLERLREYHRQLDRAIARPQKPRLSISEANGLAGAKKTAANDSGSQAATVQQPFLNALPCQGLKVAARLTKPNALQDHITHPEFLADKMIERNSPGN